LSQVPARELGATVVCAAIQWAQLPDLAVIDEVFMGNVVSAGLAQNIAQQCAINDGLPTSVGETTVNKVCAASLKVGNASRGRN